jgi:hypothetical protein
MMRLPEASARPVLERLWRVPIFASSSQSCSSYPTSCWFVLSVWVSVRALPFLLLPHCADSSSCCFVFRSRPSFGVRTLNVARRGEGGQGGEKARWLHTPMEEKGCIEVRCTPLVTPSPPSIHPRLLPSSLLLLLLLRSDFGVEQIERVGASEEEEGGDARQPAGSTGEEMSLR